MDLLDRYFLGDVDHFLRGEDEIKEFNFINHIIMRHLENDDFCFDRKINTFCVNYFRFYLILGDRRFKKQIV